jgi:Holliday junction resolvasome RuvABC ATP-dependent DNA helicase subunit
MEGYLERTPKGRVATAQAYETLGLKRAAQQATLNI